MDEARCYESLDCDARVEILRDHVVENCIGDLVADFVRVTFRNRFGSEVPQIIECHVLPYLREVVTELKESPEASCARV